MRQLSSVFRYRAYITFMVSRTDTNATSVAHWQFHGSRILTPATQGTHWDGIGSELYSKLQRIFGRIPHDQVHRNPARCERQHVLRHNRDGSPSPLHSQAHRESGWIYHSFWYVLLPGLLTLWVIPPLNVPPICSLPVRFGPSLWITRS